MRVCGPVAANLVPGEPEAGEEFLVLDLGGLEPLYVAELVGYGQFSKPVVLVKHV